MEKPNQTNPDDPVEAFDPAKILLKKIVQKGFLRAGQITETFKIDFPGQIVLNSFNDRITGFGSCFAINLKDALKLYFPRFYFDRPISAHYSSESIASILQVISGEREHSEEEISFLNPQKTDVLANHYFRLRRLGPHALDHLNSEIKRLDDECRNAVTHSDVVIITLGTTRVLRLKRNGSLISTLVGLIDEPYETEFLSVEKNVEHLETMVRCIGNLRKNGALPRIVFTVSPQRYNWSYSVTGRNHGFFEHNLSKSVLRVALENFIQKHPDWPLYYFPSFEIAIDELRLFDSMCHYDHLHIHDPLTPRYIAKRFVETSVHPELVAAMPVVQNFENLLQEITDLIKAGADSRDRLLDVAIHGYLNTVKKHPTLKNHQGFLQALYGFFSLIKRPDLAVRFATEFTCLKELLPMILELIKINPALQDAETIKAVHRNLCREGILSSGELQAQPAEALA